MKVLGDGRNRYEFCLAGYVVMPERVHLLIGEPKKGNPSNAIQALKQSVSLRLQNKNRRKSAPSQLRLGFAVAEMHPHLWRRRFYDFNVWRFVTPAISPSIFAWRSAEYSCEEADDSTAPVSQERARMPPSVQPDPAPTPGNRIRPAEDLSARY